eukprot:scpid40417/ scgid34051/ 
MKNTHQWERYDWISELLNVGTWISHKGYQRVQRCDLLYMLERDKEHTCIESPAKSTEHISRKPLKHNMDMQQTMSVNRRTATRLHIGLHPTSSCLPVLDFLCLNVLLEMHQHFFLSHTSQVFIAVLPATCRRVIAVLAHMLDESHAVAQCPLEIAVTPLADEELVELDQQRMDGAITTSHDHGVRHKAEREGPVVQTAIRLHPFTRLSIETANEALGL